jgi:hydrogenase expression/formation protein HypC
MCLGIPGQVVSFSEETDQLAHISVAGVPRPINVGLVREDGIDVGDWVLIHMGFAMSILDEAEAATAMEGLQLLGEQYEGEIAASTPGARPPG